MSESKQCSRYETEVKSFLEKATALELEKYNRIFKLDPRSVAMAVKNSNEFKGIYVESGSTIEIRGAVSRFLETADFSIVLPFFKDKEQRHGEDWTGIPRIFEAFDSLSNEKKTVLLGKAAIGQIADIRKDIFEKKILNKEIDVSSDEELIQILEDLVKNILLNNFVDSVVEDK